MALGWMASAPWAIKAKKNVYLGIQHIFEALYKSISRLHWPRPNAADLQLVKLCVLWLFFFFLMEWNGKRVNVRACSCILLLVQSVYMCCAKIILKVWPHPTYHLEYYRINTDINFFLKGRKRTVVWKKPQQLLMNGDLPHIHQLMPECGLTVWSKSHWMARAIYNFHFNLKMCNWSHSINCNCSL